eukprot:PhM_4_TR15545/c0_g1_i1/m.105041
MTLLHDLPCDVIFVVLDYLISKNDRRTENETDRGPTHTQLKTVAGLLFVSSKLRAAMLSPTMQEFFWSDLLPLSSVIKASAPSVSFGDKSYMWHEIALAVAAADRRAHFSQKVAHALSILRLDGCDTTDVWSKAPPSASNFLTKLLRRWYRQRRLYLLGATNSGVARILYYWCDRASLSPYFIQKDPYSLESFADLERVVVYDDAKRVSYHITSWNGPTRDDDSLYYDNIMPVTNHFFNEQPLPVSDGVVWCVDGGARTTSSLDVKNFSYLTANPAIRQCATPILLLVINQEQDHSRHPVQVAMDCGLTLGEFMSGVHAESGIRVVVDSISVRAEPHEIL